MRRARAFRPFATNIALPAGLEPDRHEPGASSRSPARTFQITATFEANAGCSCAGEILHDRVITRVVANRPDVRLPQGRDLQDGHLGLSRDDISSGCGAETLSFSRTYSSSGVRS
jgi:hypothetical protein